MTRDLTIWISPWTTLRSIHDAIGVAKSIAASVSKAPPYIWQPSLLLPAHFGRWSQAECRQTLPRDMCIRSPEDAGVIRMQVEAHGLGFGTWGVPVDQSSAELAAAYAAASGYYAMNIEPGEFWLPGDDPAAIDAWWGTFWNALPDPDALSGNVSATVVPNGWGLGAFKNSLPNLAAGCGALALEVYGGSNTQASYPEPNLWPEDGFAQVRATGVEATLIPILARANVAKQIGLASWLGHSNVHVWCI